MDVSTVCLSVHQSPKMPIYHRYVVPWNISNRFQWHSSWSHWIQSNAITVDSTFQSTVDDQMKINGNSSSSIQRDIKDRSIHPVSIHSLSLPSFIRPSFVRPSVPIFSLSLLFFFFFLQLLLYLTHCFGIEFEIGLRWIHFKSKGLARSDQVQSVGL